MSKSTAKNNMMTHNQIKKACDEVGRSEQRVQSQYCEVATRIKVTVLEGYREKEFRGVPCGWSY